LFGFGNGGPFAEDPDPNANNGSATEEKLTLEHVGGLDEHIKYT